CGAVPAGHVRCHAEVVTDAENHPLATSTPQGGYFPADLQSAYALSTLAANNGAGRTVAIVDAFDDPNAKADLDTYRAQFGLPALGTCGSSSPCFSKIDQDGGTSYPAGNIG